MPKMRKGRLAPDLFLKKKFLKKAYYEVKASGLQLSFNISIALNLAYSKNKLYKTLRLLIQRYAQF